MNLMTSVVVLCLVRKNLYVRQGDQRVHVQKRLLLGNLKEVYQQFKEKHPMEKIGFSKFSELRPQHCVLAGASGTHAVCVCTIHQNVKLMMIGVLPMTIFHSRNILTVLQKLSAIHHSQIVISSFVTHVLKFQV